ncbi:MAG: c-type cytochrome [Betaproteobacteria bacterium]|nr:c-type cytochrome [Betaproteobacteria bacterium]
MRSMLIVALALLPVCAALADAPDTAASPRGIGAKDYVWNRMTPEQVEVLRKTGDAARGREAFRGCRGCHRSDGFGRVDGIYPKLTGQHAAVIIKQVTDIRAGVRINPKMEPFSSDHAVSPQEIADIAAFLAAETTIKENGKGPGDQVRVGEQIYTQRGCFKCHGRRGEGNEEKMYPAVAAQHYSYLLREMQLIKLEARGNSHPDMVTVLRDFSTADLEAVADYLSRMPDHRQARAPEGGK